jgi:hypothetical protein
MSVGIVRMEAILRIAMRAAITTKVGMLERNSHKPRHGSDVTVCNSDPSRSNDFTIGIEQLKPQACNSHFECFG